MSAAGSEDQLLDEPRPRSFAIAYRTLGSVAEVEDVVQEALLRSTAGCKAASGSSRRRSWPR
ncbi:MAG: sigma factor [Solirubrobacteraceae bacterium]